MSYHADHVTGDDPISKCLKRFDTLYEAAKADLGRLRSLRVVSRLNLLSRRFHSDAAASKRAEGFIMARVLSSGEGADIGSGSGVDDVTGR